MVNLPYFNDTHNFIYSLINIFIVLGTILKTYTMYKETGQKRFIFFASIFLISILFKLIDIFLILDNNYLEFLNTFFKRLYQCIGLIGILFIQDNTGNEKITAKEYTIYFGSFITILVFEYLLIYLNLTPPILSNLLNNIITFIFISILFAFVLTKSLKRKSPFNSFNIGLFFLSLSSIYIINPTYYVALYQNLTQLFRILGNFLIFLGIDAIKENFQECRLRLKLILLPNLYMLLYFIIFIIYDNLLFNLNFPNEIYAVHLLFYILYLTTQSIFISRTTYHITEITQHFTEFEPNKKPVLINIYENDEIGKLAENINKVSEKQWKYTQEIKEKQLQIQDLMNSRDSFIAALSHDLKSPIFAEQKFIESILLDKENIKVPAIIEALEDMYKINDEVLRIVNNLLTAYYLDSQKLELHCEASDINLLIKNAENTLKHLAKDQNIDLSMNLMPNIPPICVDKDMLSRVITNLLSNAIKHGKTSTEIKISTLQVDENIQVSIQDYGKGIPEEEKINIFQKYPSSKRTVGTGLGLYISKQIIDAHDGKIWFESEIDKGTIFYFTLPLEQ